MNLLIEVKNKKISLEIKKDQKTVDKIFWQDENNLSLSLLKNLDKLLNRNKLKAMDLRKSDVNIVSAGFSTDRIVSTVSKTVNYCLTK